jgi:hypothetical protein
MSQALIAPEYELFPNRYRWSVADCYRLAEEGRLVGRYEVLDGEVITKTGRKPPHFLGISLLTRWANSTFGDQFVRVQGPIALSMPDGEFSESEPDIAITNKSASSFGDHHPGPSDIVLIAEVSDTSLPTDLLVKSRLYARAYVSEYWILGLNARSLRIHLDPVDGQYRVVTTHSEVEIVASAARPDARVIVADLLPPVAG